MTPLPPSGIGDAAVVWLSVPRPSGPPHTTPVWFVLVDGRIWIASSTVNRKVQLLQDHPSVSLAVDGSGSEPSVAEGTATIHHDLDRFPSILAALAEKHPGWDPADPEQDGPRVLVEVAVTRWLMGGPTTQR